MEMTLILDEAELNAAVLRTIKSAFKGRRITIAVAEEGVLPTDEATLLAKIEAGKQADSTVVFKGDQFADFVAQMERGEQPDSQPYQISVKA